MCLKNLMYTAALACAATLLVACQFEDSANQIAASEKLADAMDDTVIEHAQKHADETYVCPMHPEIVRGEPGNCPICGMALEKQEVQSDERQDFGPPIVTVRPETLQNMGVRTAQVETGPLRRRIETVGYVDYDEDHISHVHPRVSGWVEKLWVRTEGEAVKRGQTLLEFYSPEIVTAQEEYLLALDGLKANRRPGRDMVQAGRRRLRLLDVPDSVIDTLAKTRQVQETVPMLAPISGIITKMGLREGMYIQPDKELFTISDISSVWVQVDVFEHQLEWVQPGQPARIQVAALPGQIREGQVDYVYPELDPMTRTLRVRLRFPNPGGILKPNMFARALIYSGPKQGVLSIPREALIITGGQERVVLALGQGRFQPTEVTSGMNVQDRVEILSGLETGQEVVVSGQFLIDSESNLQASFRRMRTPEKIQEEAQDEAIPSMAQHQH